MNHKLLTGRCEIRLKELPDNSIDSIVTDPPYHLTSEKKGGSGEASLNLNSPAGRSRITTGFMGMAWDGGDIAYNVDMWRECLRVLKPGGHLLAFGGSRTYHRLACAVEDAGFEIRDQIMWVYGSGFPKSMDVSKAIDKAAGAEREVVGVKPGHEGFVERTDAHSSGGRKEGWERPWKDDPEAVRLSHMQTAPTTHDAKKWDGWGTALKPAHEPIVLARKPLSEGTVANNVLTHGTGALNIGASRVGNEDRTYSLKGGENLNQLSRPDGSDSEDAKGCGAYGIGAKQISIGEKSVSGRWPANLIHDGSEEVVACFPAEAGAAAPVTVRNGDKFRNAFGKFAGNIDVQGSTFHGDSGSAARFFYCAKAGREDRNEGCEEFDSKPLLWSSGTKSPGTFQAEGTDRTSRNNHPTVKPTDLMRYLCRLVTPPGGTVLDPFTGSGSTGKAAILEGFNFIGIEQSEEYVAIAEARIAFAIEEVKRGTAQQVLFA